MQALADPTYVVDKPSNASFADLPWIKVPEGKLFWLFVKSGTAVTGSFAFKGAVVSQADTVDVTLPSGLVLHYTASAGSIAISTNTVALTGFAGTFAVGFADPFPQLRPDFTRSSGGSATGSAGFQFATFQRAV
jgi:hypothetical protein